MALKFEGAPYVWGGDSPAGWDCSGFIQYVYGKAGISLPHNTTAIRTSGKFVKTSNPKPGDLVYQNGGSHAGIYIGGGKIIGAQNPSVDTVIRDADSPYGPLMGYYTLAN
ncbi:NlpC/P60 family protein [Arthrobacter sp. AQ5-05]|uniref:C40 family peptidase n=1 Tax=Arthrobacter sp. AQ5-05 TaxID=2184581 RepID=UPI0015EC9D18|nr:NlpC/P60 family protein [Arthrobacter sp. AQ5-05]